MFMRLSVLLALNWYFSFITDDEMESSSHRKYRQDPLISCFVPSCKNTALLSPDKHFFPVPRRNRSEWCAADKKGNVPKSAIYICEDHINLEEDLSNYNNWIKGVRGRLKERVPVMKNIGVAELQESVFELLPTAVPKNEDKGVLCVPQCSHKSVQVKPVSVTRSTMTKKTKICAVPEEEHVLVEEESPSSVGTTTEFSETESSGISGIVKQDLCGRSFLLKLIKAKSFNYIGLKKQFYWIIEYLGKHCRVTELHIIITLYKIKNNDTFSKISDIFQISLVSVWRIFYKTLKLLASFFKHLVYWPSAIDIKQNLPLVFRTTQEYSDIQSIIDCFEIEIEKPKNPVYQSLTWSQYKNCNSIKYLIGVTPDGFINFISEGYGGRISDMNLVEQSGFLETIPEKCTILADRGFKHLESLLSRKSVSVLRPPSVTKNTKMTKSEVITSKVLASLRIHVERVIRRVRLYKLLKPHSVVNNKIVCALDDAVLVSCGLVNLQPSIIKYY